MYKALVPPKILVPPSFFPTPNLNNWFPPFVSKILENFLPANLSNFALIYRNYCKNTLYYYLSMICTINVQKGCNGCCRKQFFVEIYANLSLKVPIFVLFYPYIQHKKLGSPLSFCKSSSLLLVSPIPQVFLNF